MEREEQARQSYKDWVRKKGNQLRSQRSQSRRFNSSNYFNSGSFIQSKHSWEQSSAYDATHGYASPMPPFGPPGMSSDGFHDYIDAIYDTSRKSCLNIRYGSQRSLQLRDQTPQPQQKKYKLPSRVSITDLNESISRPESKNEKREQKCDELTILIEQIWPIYDVDQSGTLDKQETRRFVVQYMETMGF